MRFLSVCSGIEAASVAWSPLGWKAVAFSEIEPFPSAVLAHHYPSVPNLGDMTKIARAILTGEVPAPDVLCGGTPCQAFSVAGLRESLADARGNLTLKFVEIANAIDHVRAGRGEDECIVFWENVPGVLSTKDNAFGCFLGGLAGEDGPLEPPGGKWANAGAVHGPRRAIAWRTLDAQYFGVAQRRRRVFVVASARKGFDPATVLFEWDGVRRDTAPSREARQVAPTIPSRSTEGGGLGTDFDCDGGLIARAVSLRGDGFDSSEDGTGRGTPLVPHVVGALACNTGPNGHDAGNFACNQAVDAGHVLPVAFAENSRHELRLEGGDGQRTGALSTGGGKPGQGVPAIAFPANLSGTQCVSTEELAPSMGAANPTGVAYGIRTANTSSNGWGIQEECTHTLDCAQGVAVAFTTEQTPKFNHECALTLTKQSPTGGGQFQSVMHAMQVRRLTPTEAERLQGFEPGYTAIPWRGKPADQCPDGPRYKALGNSWAVPNVRWIGQRIDAVALINKAQAATKDVAELEAA